MEVAIVSYKERTVAPLLSRYRIAFAAIKMAVYFFTMLPRESCLSKNKAMEMLVLATWKYKIATLLSIVLDRTGARGIERQLRARGTILRTLTGSRTLRCRNDIS